MRRSAKIAGVAVAALALAAGGVTLVSRNAPVHAAAPLASIGAQPVSQQTSAKSSPFQFRHGGTFNASGVTGYVAYAGNGTIDVQTLHGLVRVQLQQNTTYVQYDQKLSSAPTLLPAEGVNVTGDWSNGMLRAKEIRIIPAFVRGKVTAVSGDTLTVQSGQASVKVTTSSSTHYLGKYKAGLSSIHLGNMIMAQGAPNADGLSAAAISGASQNGGVADRHKAGQFTGISGKIVNFSNDKLTIQETSGKTQSVTVTRATKIFSERQPASSDDLKAGENVHVLLKQGTTEATVVIIQPAGSTKEQSTGGTSATIFPVT